MTAIIFGVNRQDGFYLKKILQEEGYAVIGVSRSGDNQVVDISNYEAVATLIKSSTPQYVFHLAANPTTRHYALFENHNTISTGTMNILESVKNFSVHTKVFISGSGLQFVNKDRPIKETDAFEARDAYSLSRIHSVYASRYYRLLGLQVYVGYFLTMIAPVAQKGIWQKK